MNKVYYQKFLGYVEGVTLFTKHTKKFKTKFFMKRFVKHLRKSPEVIRVVYIEK